MSSGATTVSISPSQFDDEYARIFDGDEHWAALASPTGSMYEWDASSTYVQEPPFFASITLDFADLTIVRYPHISLSDRMWALRDRFTAYDAAFVTLAEALGAPLVTCDARLSAASRLGVQIELFEHAT